jgi:hypothetical protein
VPKLSRVISLQNPAPQGEKVGHWLKGGSGMLNSTTISPLSPCARHGAACSEHGMSRALHGTGQVCVVVCPSPQSTLATGPRFVQTPAMTALGGYVTGKKRASLCGAKTQQGYKSAKPCSPGRQSRPSNGTFICLGSLEDAHHRARAVRDACIRRASSALLETNCHSPILNLT